MSVHEQILALLPAGGAGRRAPAPFGVIEVRGTDAVEFLHRLCSQDVEGLEPGHSAPAAFLSPKGKLAETAMLARVADRVFVETRAARVGPLFELLDRYHFSEKLEFRRRDDWACVEVAGRADGDAHWGCQVGRADGGDDGVTIASARHGVRWTRAHGPEPALAEFAAEVPALGDELAECLRMLSGSVQVGLDTDEGTLALEADLDDHVSTTKGCYVGQEIVARIHTYGHVNRRIALLELQAAEPIERGTPLCDADDGEPLGRVMSATRIPGGSSSIGLGFLPEALLEDPEPLVLGAEGGPAVQLLPFAPA